MKGNIRADVSRRMLFSFLLAVSMLVFMRMPTASGGIVDDQACAKHSHQQCKCNIDFDKFDIKNNKATEKQCKKLQSCVDCMAVTRCQSNDVNEYRALLRTTIVMSLVTKLCLNISLDKFDQGLMKSCEGNGTVYDHCGKQCNCASGFFASCYRARKEFTQMSFAERQWFVNAYYKATTDPSLKDDFLKILNVHSEIPTDFLHHMPHIFFPWHRWFLLKAENILRQIDCRVTIPYYQWTAAGKNVWRTTDPRDVWSGGPQGLGGNGVPPSYCVKDGKFREGNWHLPVSEGGGCLKRNFNSTCVLYTEKKLHKLLRAKSFNYFQDTVRKELHNKFYDCIGGSKSSGYSPEVLLHLAFIDKIWDQWQSKDSWHRYQYFTSINFRMPFTDLYPWQLLDSNSLPGGDGIIYLKFRKSLFMGKKPRNRKLGEDEEEEISVEEGEPATDEGEVLLDEKERVPNEAERLTDEEDRIPDEGERISDEGNRLAEDGELIEDENEDFTMKI